MRQILHYLQADKWDYRSLMDGDRKYETPGSERKYYYSQQSSHSE